MDLVNLSEMDVEEKAQALMSLAEISFIGDTAVERVHARNELSVEWARLTCAEKLDVGRVLDKKFGWTPKSRAKTFVEIHQDGKTGDIDELVFVNMELFESNVKSGTDTYAKHRIKDPFKGCSW